MRAPKPLRVSVRNARTTRTPTASARLMRTIRPMRSFAIVELRDQTLQLRNVFGAELIGFCEVRDKRGELAVEQTIDEAAALVLDVGRALHERRVEVAPSIARR